MPALRAPGGGAAGSATPRRPVRLAELLERTLAGDRRAVARVISIVESQSPLARELAIALCAPAARARVIGLTGSPGVGKSTTTSSLVGLLRAASLKVGVLAVDPSSPFSGGALLGDRVRMQEHAGDPGVFIRSLASRGQLGGLSAAVPQALRVLEAAGYEVVLIETVGVGQAEIEIASLADTTVVLLAPGMGDGIQAAKAGILEIADVLVVNKADRDGAATVARDLRRIRSLTATAGWPVPVITSVATRGEGIEQLRDSLAAHHDWLRRTGELTRRRTSRAATEIEAIALATLGRRVAELRVGGALQASAAQVAVGRLDPFSAADRVVDAVTAR